ncbi:aldehyde dehydrogenase family protein [Arcobacter sp. FWKO B]|uniref:aldehyde dehydrogenase family protein n=1 Tax=Arcobacter sp. FWKO B TaxID=2593672 RepID=UPI0018A62EB1|nr:aldehyde dehydrogenase family protein [Arcobacter sp. FWKO B]QOG12580.1 aldehyde dehydrogenase family protein [Arcobacter sp. FWKO B]
MVANIFFGSNEVEGNNLENRVSPYSNKIVSKYPKCTKEDTIKALNIAQNASVTCRNSTLSQRIAWLEDVALRLSENLEDIAKTITDEVGKPIYFSKIEVARAVETIKISAYKMASIGGKTIPTDIAPSGKKTHAFYKRVPVGVVACITPFNFPLNLIIHKIAPALVSGNAVVLKPTPEAPLTAYKICKLFIESPYAIKDALSLVYGDVEVGSTLVSSDIPRVISFTGSVPVGKIITKSAGIKKVSLELGGNAATFIEKSADLDLAAARCTYGAFYNSGQVCISLQRIYVQDEVYEEFANKLATQTASLKVGSPYENETFVGPLINEEAVNRAKNWIDSAIKEGAKAICGGDSQGNCLYPTIMTEVTDDMNIVCEEAFAPIVSLIRVKTYEEALEKINNSPYGLQYSIFTNDLKLSTRFIDDALCGGVVINDIPTLRFDVQPYGGMKESGIGKEGPEFAIEEFTEIKSIVIC